jgi:ADP-ribose pyrophosphatase YjhB (NUDIX family)
MTGGTERDAFSAALAGVIAELPSDLPVAADSAVAARLDGAPRGLDGTPLAEIVPGTVASVLLVDDEVSRDGDRAEELISLAAEAVRPAGLVVISALVGSDADGGPRGVAAPRVSPALRTEPRSYDAAGVEHLLLHRGMRVLRLERHTGGDGVERFLVVGQAPISEQERSSRFIASLPFKLVTAAVVCTDAENRLLCVFDLFRRHWTIPGGVVDAREDPRSGAVREAVEEGGVRVEAGSLLGAFQLAFPDRLLMIYAARPLEPDDPATRTPTTRQPHEIGEVRWVPLPEALPLLNPRSRWQVQQCLDAPGETWRE